MAQVKINFPSDAAAKEFCTWLCEQGEQDYWGWMEICDPSKEKTVVFKYHAPLDMSFPQDDKRRYKNATFCPNFEIGTNLYNFTE